MASMAALAAASVGGCSFLLVRPSPRSTLTDEDQLVSVEGRATAASLKCDSYIVPALDLLGLPLGGLGLLGYALDPPGERCKDQPDGCRDDARRPVVYGIAVAVLFLTSSIYGFAENTVCRDRLWERQESRTLELVIAARTAAQRNDCVSVIATGKQLKHASTDIHATLFISDPAIQRCLPAPARPPAPRKTAVDDEATLSGDPRARALQLTRLSADRAARGDCAPVRSHSARVRSLDPVVHATVFVGDAAIKRCLAETPVPVVVPPVTAPVPAVPSPITPPDEVTDPLP